MIACALLASSSGCNDSAGPTGETGQGTAMGGTSSAAGAAGNAVAASAGSVLSSGGASSGGASSSAGAGHAGAAASGGASTSSAGSAGEASSNGGNNSAGGSSAGSGSSAGGGSSAGASGAPNSCPPSTPLTGGQKYCSNQKGSAGGGYAYELWASGSGSGCMTVYGSNAAFNANWSNVGDFLARIGLGFDQTKTPAQIGVLSADFAETKTGGDGLVYVGIYGWTVSPLREYYILDDWGTTKPADVASDGTPRTKVGTIIVDGGTYDVWKHTQTNKPAITGDNQTFDQYFSIRQTARSCGHISISDHFSQWTALGLQLGKLEEAKLLLEAQASSGTIDFTTATVVLK